MACIGFAALAGLLLFVAGTGPALGSFNTPQPIAATTMPPESWTMGREMPKKLRMVAPSSSKITRKTMLLMAMRRARVKDLGRRIADEAEKNQGGAERVDQRQEHAERDEKCFPNRQESSPLMNLNCWLGGWGDWPRAGPHPAGGAGTGAARKTLRGREP